MGWLVGEMLALKGQAVWSCLSAVLYQILYIRNGEGCGQISIGYHTNSMYWDR